jgi:large subunit ribosomal protein L17
MRHAKPFRKLSRQRSHYTSLMRNLAFALFQNERIKTTDKKAKEVRRFIDKIITLGKKGGLHNRRNAFALMGNITGQIKGKRIDILKKVFDDIAKRSDRSGGYTRIIPLGNRPGDAAPIVYLELVDRKVEDKKKKKDDTPAADEKKKPAAKKKADPKKETKKKAAATG